MNIYFLITGLNSGGTERNLFYICNDLKKKNNITVVVLGGKDFYSNDFLNIGCRVKYLELDKFKFKSFFNFLWEFIKSNQRNTIIVSWLYHADLFSILLKFLKPKIKIFWNIRGGEIGHKYFSYHKIVLKILKYFSYIVPTKILYNSYRGKNEHEKFGYKKNGKIVKNIFFSPKKYYSNLEIKLDPTKIYFGFIGRNAPQKGIDILLKVFSKFVEKNPNCNLILAGFNITNSGYEKYISNNIKFIGKIKNVRSMYEQLDVFVLPSLYGEGVPNVILEALYFNLPCISTNVGDTSGLLASGRGIIVQPSDSDGLLNAFYNMLDYLKKNQNAQNGFRKNYVLKEFNPNICLEKYSKLILVADED